MRHRRIALDVAQAAEHAVGRNDTAADSAFKFPAPGRTDGIDTTAGGPRAAPESQRGAIARVGLEDGDIALLGDALDRGKRFQAVRPAYTHILLVSYNMGVGQKIAVRGYQEAGSAARTGQDRHHASCRIGDLALG